MKDILKYIVLPISIIVGIIIAIGLGTVAMNNTYEEQQLKSYQECKERTQDIEWCFNKFRPNL